MKTKVAVALAAVLLAFAWIVCTRDSPQPQFSFIGFREPRGGDRVAVFRITNTSGRPYSFRGFDTNAPCYAIHVVGGSHENDGGGCTLDAKTKKLWAERHSRGGPCGCGPRPEYQLLAPRRAFEFEVVLPKNFVSPAVLGIEFVCGTPIQIERRIDDYIYGGVGDASRLSKFRSWLRLWFPSRLFPPATWSDPIPSEPLTPRVGVAK